MGAGKTTVIGPILAMMLADGKSLVTQVMPKALLEMSRSVLRRAFSSVVNKRIYTLEFDRSTDDSEKQLNKLFIRLDRARQARGIVVTTPEAIKSLMLKYVDLLQSVQAASTLLSVPAARLPLVRQDRAVSLATELRENELKADALHRIVQLWTKEENGVALLDEVDLLLHPLRSELVRACTHTIVVKL